MMAFYVKKNPRLLINSGYNILCMSSLADGLGRKKKMLIAAAVIALMLLAVLALVVTVGGYFAYKKFFAGSGDEVEGVIDYPDMSPPNETTTTTDETTSVASAAPTTSVATTVPTTVPTTSVATTSVAESCFDGTQNQDETGVDCGGVCMSCVRSAGDVAACFNAEGVKLYTRGSICGKCNTIRNFFKTSYSSLTVEDCEDEDDRDECAEDLEDDYDVDDDDVGYPTWVYFGEAYPGYTVAQMQKITGCI